MEWTIERDLQRKILTVTTAGELSLSRLYAMSAEVIALGATCDMHRFLIDHRDTALPIRPVDALETLPVLQTLGLPRAARIALVHAERDGELFRFFEDAAANRGFRVRVFTDPLAAVRWLVG